MSLFHHMKYRLLKVTLTGVIALVIIQYWLRASFDEHHLEPLFVINSTRARALATSTSTTNTTITASNHHEHDVMTADTNNFLADNSSSASSSSSSSSASSSQNITSSSNTAYLNGTGDGVQNRTSTPAPVPDCPPVPPNLNGPLDVLKDYTSLEEVEKQLPVAGVLGPGGTYHPSECKARYRVALVIPYRDRADQLAIFLNNIHRVLPKQQIDYEIFVVEQQGDSPFNRGKLMNVGFTEASKLRPFDCFIFHDVDLLPEDDRNLYTCPEQPRHMSVAVDKFKYKLPYKEIFGGVSALSREHFIKVNGFSNSFWGWGGEDDDMYSRIRRAGLHVSRYPPTMARYMMLQHSKQKPNPKRFEILHQGKKRYSTEGLNSLKYECKALELRKLYTWILADLQPPS